MTQTTDFLNAENERLKSIIIDFTLTRGEDEKRTATLEAENARLTAANESMQEDAVQNTYAFGLMLKANKEQAAEIAQLTEKVRYAYVQIEALERVK